MTRAVGFGIESAYGTASATITYLKVTSFDHTVDRGAMFEETIDTIFYNAAYGGALKITGSIESNFRPDQHAKLLEAFMGTKADGPPVVYTLAPTPKALTCNVIDDSACAANTKTRQLLGVGLKTMNFTFAPKDYVKVKHDFFAQNIKDITTTPTVSFVDETPLIFDGASIIIGGTENIKVKAIDLTLDRKLDEDNFVIGRSVVQPACTTSPGVAGVMDAGGTLTFSQAAWEDYALATFGTATLTEKEIAEYVGETSTYPNTLANQTVKIQMKRPNGDKAAEISCGSLVFSDAQATMQGRNAVDKKVNFKLVGSDFTIKTGATAWTSGYATSYDGDDKDGY